MRSGRGLLVIIDCVTPLKMNFYQLVGEAKCSLYSITSSAQKSRNLCFLIVHVYREHFYTERYRWN